MNKRKQVKDWLSSLENLRNFTILEAAKEIGVNTKDVSNIISKLHKERALSRIRLKGSHRFTYVVDNRLLKIALKKMHTKGERKILPPVIKTKQDSTLVKLYQESLDKEQAVSIDAYKASNNGSKDKPMVDRVRKSPRSHFVMALDNEIKELEDKIKQLRTIRKGFV